MNKFIKARFKSSCSQTGTIIKKGDNILFDTNTKKVFCEQSEKYQSELECVNVASCVQANEDAYFDDFCQRNNI